MVKTLLWPMLLIFIPVSGCTEAKHSDALIGTWTMSLHVSPEEWAKLSSEPLPDGVSMEMTMTGTNSYHHGGKYSGDGEISMRFHTNGEEVALRLSMRDAGTWEIHEDTLVETTVDSVVTPLDDTTRLFFEESPELSAMLVPVKGETTSLKILELTSSIAELEMEDPKLRFILRKKK